MRSDSLVLREFGGIARVDFRDGADRVIPRIPGDTWTIAHRGRRGQVVEHHPAKVGFPCRVVSAWARRFDVRGAVQLLRRAAVLSRATSRTGNES